MATKRSELLKFDGTPRSELEARIRKLVLVLDAADALIVADDAARDVIDDDEATAADEKHERAWDALREALSLIG